MKRFIVLLVLMTLTSVALAQVPTPATNPRIIDSTGVATKHWQEVDFITSAVRNVTYLNKSTTKTLRIALRGEDTVSTQTRYQTLLAPGRTATLGTTQRYAYIRTDDTAGTPTAAYSISNVLTMDLGGGSDSSVVLLDGIKDTLSNRFPASKPRMVIDTSFVRPLTGAQTYAANDEVTDTAGVIRSWSGVALANGGEATIHSIRVVVDSIANGATFRIWPIKNTTAVVADNGVFTFVGNPSDYFEPITVTVNSSTGSTFSVGSTSFAGVRVQTGSASTSLFYRLEILTASTLKLGAKIRTYVTLIYD